MRGRGPSASGEADDNPANNDAIIQGTDNDALGSRLSAVNAGYLQDSYIKYFYTDDVPSTRFPIINRGNDYM
jgi:[phosphatase 2A protein]-leucine-carboxy methyltransferase